MNERQHYGFFDQFRALHWAVKLIIVVALSPFALPVLVAAASVATRVAGGFGVFLVVVAGFALAFWFAFTSPPKLGERDALSDDEREAITALPPKPAGTVRNYCESCGEAFDRGLWRCPACNARWKAPKLDEPVGAAAHYLNLITRDFESGWITRPDFLRLTTEYERRLRESRPQPQMEPEPVREPAAPPPSTEVTATKPAVPVSLPPAPVAKEPVAAITPAAEVLVTQVEPVRPRAAVPTAAAEAPAPAPGPSRPTVGEMGRAVIGWAAERQADILLYAGAFMLSIAAIIFVAYQGTALSGDLRFTILTTYAAGFLGFGLWLHRWERVKEAAPVFLGLGAILVPIDFLALRTLVLDEGQVSNAMLWFLGSSSCAALYFLLALRGYGRYYFAPAIPSALIAWGSLGAVVGLPDAWFGPWYVAIAVPAYVWSVANRDRNPLSPWITAGSLVVAVPAVAVAHGIPAMTGDDRFAAPMAYILAGLAVSAGLRWRRDIAALAALPAIGAAAMGTLVWAAFDPAPEWNVPWIAAAGLGWLIVANFDAAGRARSWAGLAAFAGSSAVLAAHLAVATPGVDPGVLPVSYALAFIGASGAYARWRWFEAAALMPPASAMVVLTTAWAAGGANVEWYGSYAGIAPLGYLALALFDAPDRRRAWQFALAATAPIGPAISHSALAVNESAHHWSLAAAYAPVLATAVIATWRWRFLWRLAPGSLPVVAAATALAAAWAQWDLAVEWFPAFAAAAAIGYIVLAWLDVPAVAKSWATIGGIAGEIGLMGAHIAVLDPDASRWALPLAYGLVLTTASGAFAKWRFEWSPPAGFLPPLTALTSLTFAWAWWDLAPEWYGAFAAGAALGYVALAWFEASRNRRWWLAFALASGSLGVAGAHAAMALEDASRWALPVAYAIALSGAAITFARWRYTWRLAPGLVPPLTALTALTFGWAQWDLAPAWYPPFAAAAGIGFLALAWFDDKQFARLWGGWFGLAAVGAIGSAHAAVLLDDGSRWELPLTYSLALCGLMVSFARWRWVEAAAALPPVLAMTALTASWAQFDLAPQWFGTFAAATSFGYLALARFDFKERRPAWWAWAAAGPIVGIGLAHSLVALESSEKYAISAAYGVSLAAAALAFVTWRFAWRIAPATIPALASATALSFAWARWDTELWWWGAFIAPAAYGYVALALLDEKSRIRSWLGGSLLAGLVAIPLAQGMQMDSLATHRALPVTYGEAAIAAAAAVALWRFKVREAIVVLPPIIASFGAALGWAEFDMRLQWLTAWTAGAGAAYLIPAYFESRQRKAWQTASLMIGVGALLAAHGLAFEEDPVRWQLPVAYAVLFGAWTWQAVALRDESVLAPPLLASLLGASTLWAAGAGPEWWAYPALAVAAGMAAAEPLLQRAKVPVRALWTYLLLLGSAATIATLPVNYTHPEHALATQVITAALLFVGAWRSNNSIVRLFEPNASAFALSAERIVLVQAGFAFLFGAAASMNGVLGVSGADRAWALTAMATVPWLILGVNHPRRDSLWTFTPIGLAGLTIGSALAVGSDGVLTAVLAVASMCPVVAYFGLRRWAFLGIANSFLMLTVWAGWRWQDADLAYLPLGLAAVGTAEWAVLTRLRKYTPTPGESDMVIAYLSWGPWLIAGGVAGLLLQRKQEALDAGTSLVTTAEWALAAAVLAMAAAAVTGEGLRLWRRWVWMGGSAGLLVALLMGIATFEPSNVQAYTAPIGAYLVFAGLTFRRSPQLFREHLFVHEAVMLTGTLFLVLPPAEQSFEPGGGVYGLELIGISLVLLAVGLLLHGRWLVAAALVTMTATGMRMVTGGLFSTPYWLLLGVGGTVLLSFGVLVLLERERWDRFRHRVVDWWEETAIKGPPAEPTGMAR